MMFTKDEKMTTNRSDHRTFVTQFTTLQSMYCLAVCVFIVFSGIMTNVDSIEWLALSTVNSHWNRSRDCRSLPLPNHPHYSSRHQHQFPVSSASRHHQRYQQQQHQLPVLRLPPTQRQMCSSELWLMPIVAHAARVTTEICQEQFADKRWNCSSITLAPQLTADLTGGSREQAFVYALASASLVHSVAKACSSGVVTGCGCGGLPLSEKTLPPTADFKWDGCNDNVAIGQRYAQKFVNGPWMTSRAAASDGPALAVDTTAAAKLQQQSSSSSSKRAMTILHNNAVGRKLAVTSMTTACKCHGVSGSCSVKTCWKSLSDMRSIGTALSKSYNMAVEVKLRRQQTPGRRQNASRSRLLVPAKHTGRNSYSEDDLIFYTQSPDYCLPDASLGSVGTTDRVCDKEHPGPGGCQSMCCGRGFTTFRTEVQFRCDCKYYWCCYVKCKTCRKEIEINRCR